MKARTIAVLLLGVVLVLSASVVGGAYLLFNDSGTPNDGTTTPAPNTPAPTPTATPDAVEACLTPAPTDSDSPATTTITIDDRTFNSDDLETSTEGVLVEQLSTQQNPVEMHDTLSVVARQHAEATAGGNEYDYTVADNCELNTMHTTILSSDVGRATPSVIGQTLVSSLSSEELSQIGADHDAVAAGVYLTNGEIHLSVVTLDRTN